MVQVSASECPNVNEFTERVSPLITSVVREITNGAEHPRIGFVLIGVSLNEDASPHELGIVHNAPDHKSAYMLLEATLSEYMATQGLPTILMMSRMTEAAKICHQILDGVLSGKVVKIETRNEPNTVASFTGLVPEADREAH